MGNLEARGFRELEAKLDRLPATMAREYLVDAVQAGAAQIRYEAARRAPQDSGELAASIAIRMTKQRSTGGDPRAEIGPDRANAAKGRFQEHGTAHHAAQPFLRPALDARGDDAIEIMRSVLASRLEGEAG